MVLVLLPLYHLNKLFLDFLGSIQKAESLNWNNILDNVSLYADFYGNVSGEMFSFSGEIFCLGYTVAEHNVCFISLWYSWLEIDLAISGGSVMYFLPKSYNLVI